MADTPEPPKADGGPKGLKKGLLTGKNKWYVIGGLGVLAVLVFFFVSRSGSNAASGGTTSTTGGALDPTTQAALQGALQGQASGGFGTEGPAGAAGPAGPPGATGKPGKAGKPGKNAPGHPIKHKAPPHKRVGHTQFVTVRPGDTLSKIAQQNHIKGGWEALYHQNRGVVGSNPNTIHPGQRLKI